MINISPLFGFDQILNLAGLCSKLIRSKEIWPLCLSLCAWRKTAIELRDKLSRRCQTGEAKPEWMEGEFLSLYPFPVFACIAGFVS